MSKKQLSVLRLKNFSKTPHHDTDFYIRTFQEHKKEHPFVMQPHAHDFYMIMIFSQGRGKHTIDLKEYPVEAGSVFFMSPGQVHSWNLDEGTDGYVIFFNSSFYRMTSEAKNIQSFSLFSGNEKYSHALLKAHQLDDLLLYLKLLESENQSHSAFKGNIVRLLTDVIINKLASCMEITIKNHPLVSILPALEKLIELNFREHLPVSFYAEKLNLSLQALNLHTRNFLNKTVNNLLHERVISEAKRLLIYSDKTVTEIAYELNFNDNSYFVKFFKKKEKLTPEEFRKKYNYTANT
ncbi:MAG TPA: AraC family transcriptional regulator [Bacteroidia bacterium]|jgi:AraC-like DNA-binding protein